METPTKEQLKAAAERSAAMLLEVQKKFPDADPLAMGVLGASMISAAIVVDDFDPFFWVRFIFDPTSRTAEYPHSTEKSLALIRAGVEAGVMDSATMTIVVIVDKAGGLDLSTVAPTQKIAERANDVLRWAAMCISSSSTVLRDRIDIARNT